MQRSTMLLIYCLLLLSSCAQRSHFRYFGPKKITLKLDPFTGIPDTSAPYDRYFYLRRYIKKTEDRQIVNVSLFERKKISLKLKGYPLTANTLLFQPIAASDVPDYNSFDILMPPLHPNRIYEPVVLFTIGSKRRKDLVEVFKLYRAGRQSDAEVIINTINAEKRKVGDKALFNINDVKTYYDQNVKTTLSTSTNPDVDLERILSSKIEIDRSLPDGSSQRARIFYDSQFIDPLYLQSYDINTRTQGIVTVDVGYIFYGLQNSLLGGTPYMGVNIFLRPLDPAIPFSFVRNRLSLIEYFSINIGITNTSLAKEGARKDLFGKNNVMTGVGFRLNNVLKLNGGILYYYKLSPNPLLDKKEFAFIPYAGISLDIRLQTILKDFAKLFTPTL